MTLSHGNGVNILKFQDVTKNTETGSIRVIFRKFKYSWGRQKVLEIASQLIKCPVKALEEYLEIRGSQPGYLYICPSGVPITRTEFVQVLNYALNFCGLDPSVYKTHSFRKGAASHAIGLGHTESQVKEDGTPMHLSNISVSEYG